MSFLTQGNTNWKFIAIVAVLAIIVGAGTFGYLQLTEEEFKIPPVDITEIDIEDETVDWLTYRNEEYGFEFQYPGHLGKFQEIAEEKVEIFPGHPSYKFNRGLTYYSDKSSFYVLYENKDFAFESDYPLYHRAIDDMPVVFGEVGDVDNYCAELKKIKKSILNCEVVEVDGQKGILRDDIFCVASPTGGGVGCSFYRLFLIDTHNTDYPVLIISLFLETAGDFENGQLCWLEDCWSWDEVSQQGEKLSSFQQAVKQRQEVISAFNQILSTFRFIEETTPIPVIDSISPNSGPVGTVIEIRGDHFAGFEGDLDAWIENADGTKGYIYCGNNLGENQGSNNNLLKFVLEPSYFNCNSSYSGLPCSGFLSVVPGVYKIYVYPWGIKSNEVNFTVTSSR